MKKDGPPKLARWFGAAALLFAANGCDAPAVPKRQGPPRPPVAAAPREQVSREPLEAQAARQPAEDDAVDYLPLSENSRWEYDVSLDLPLGASQQARAVTEVAGLVEIDGKTYYKVVMQVSGAPVNPKHVAYYRPTPRGMFQILEGEEEHGEWLYLPPRLKLGQKWSADTGKSTFNFEVVDRRDLDCLGKTYQDCWLIVIEMRSKFGSIKQEQWLAPGVGPVKQVDHHTLFDSTAVLKKYVAGKPPSQSPKPNPKSPE